VHLDTLLIAPVIDTDGQLITSFAQISTNNARRQCITPCRRAKLDYGVGIYRVHTAGPVLPVVVSS
jgi:hypothetical protein